MMNYRREIDGLRALAVVPVILFHAGFKVFGGGFVGVDIFFVISGYLITTIILAEKKEGTFTLINFYERRARRILPALFLVMFISLPFAWLWLLPRDMESFSQSLAAVSIFASNILFWKTSDYFSGATELKPLLHTWSLSVEEQYYIFFPIFIIIFWRFGARLILIILTLVAIVSFSLAQWGSTHQPIAAFYLLPTRGWELLIGAFVAFYLIKKEKMQPGNQFISLIGLFMICGSILFFDENTPFPGTYALIPTIGAALIMLFANQKTIVGKLLGGKVVVWIGLVSYSAYLWHQPLLAFSKYRSVDNLSDLVLAVICVFTFVLAYASWRYVEIPFRNKKHYSRKMIFFYSAFFSVFFTVFGLIGHMSKGYPDRLPNNIKLADIDLPRIDNGWCFYSIDSISSLSIGEKGLSCWLGEKSSKTMGLLFGDSFAGQYEPLWDKAASTEKLKINSITTNWCYPSINEDFTGKKSSRAFDQCLLNRKFLLKNISKYDFVIFGGDWGSVLSQDKLDGTLKMIDYSASKTKIVIIMPSPKIFDKNIMDAYMKKKWFGEEFNLKNGSSRKELLAIKANRIISEFSKTYKNVIFVDRASIFSVDGILSDLTSQKIPFSLDGSHISIYGSKVASEIFLLSPEYSSFKRILQ